MRRTSSSTPLGGVLVRVKDEEGWYVNTIASHRESKSVTIAITSFLHDCIIPTSIYNKEEKGAELLRERIERCGTHLQIGRN